MRYWNRQPVHSSNGRVFDADVGFSGGSENTRAFLKQGDVFTDDFIDGYIELKMAEQKRLDITPAAARVLQRLLGVTQGAAKATNAKPRSKDRGFCYGDGVIRVSRVTENAARSAN